MSDPFDEEIQIAEEVAEEAAERQEEARRSELVQIKAAIRPDWWMPEDLMVMPQVKSQGFLVNDCFVPGTINSIYGPSHSFKSWFVLFSMIQFARAQLIGTLASKTARTLFLSQELNLSAVQKRVAALLSMKEARELSDVMAFRFREEYDFMHRVKQSQAMLERVILNTNKPDIVFIDSLTQVHHGDENSNKDMGIVLSAILEVLLTHGTVCVFVHHKSGKGGDLMGRSDIASARGATVIGDTCRDMAMITALKPKDGRPRSQFKLTKHSELDDESKAPPFAFSIEPHPNFDKRVIFTFEEGEKLQDESPAVLANVEQLRAIVEEMAGDGEVMRKALIDRTASLGWGRRRFDEALSMALRGGKIAKRQERGLESHYFLPRVVKESGKG